MTPPHSATRRLTPVSPDPATAQRLPRSRRTTPHRANRCAAPRQRLARPDHLLQVCTHVPPLELPRRGAARSGAEAVRAFALVSGANSGRGGSFMVAGAQLSCDGAAATQWPALLPRNPRKNTTHCQLRQRLEVASCISAQLRIAASRSRWASAMSARERALTIAHWVSLDWTNCTTRPALRPI